ncbi:MAG TPA: ATP-binding protein [Dyella sp.]
MTDPVDRRNAPFVQLLLIGMGFLVPIDQVIHLSFASFRHSMTLPALVVDVLTDVLIMITAWVCLYLVRVGRFRLAIKSYLGVMLFSAMCAYALLGLERLSNDPFPLLLLGMSGLLLGRRALWTVFAVLMVVFAIGIVSDAITQAGQGAVAWNFGKKVSMAIGYVVVAVVLDRTSAALRESLAESNARGRMLQVTNERLYREMEDRTRAQQLLIHAQKLETVGRVAGGVAHDFSNVLGVILGYAQRRERLADSGPEALLNALQGVEMAARRGLAVTSRLLSFSREEATELEVFNADEALRELLPMVCQLFEANVRVSLALSEGPTPIRFDRSQFELVILSMAANARDAMPEGGHFQLGACPSKQRPAESIEVTLIDSGHGMSDEVKSRMFDAFYTTKPAGSGTGLGLAVVKDLVVEAGGCIDVESSPGQGTQFRIRLPRADTPHTESDLSA